MLLLDVIFVESQNRTEILRRFAPVHDGLVRGNGWQAWSLSVVFDEV